MTASLTFNIGLRYEIFKRPHFPHPENQTVSRWLIPEINGIPPEKEGIDFPKHGRDTGGRTDWNNLPHATASPGGWGAVRCLARMPAFTSASKIT